ncbi:MAG: radical SAM protein [Gammaproteobacteria bacterium]|nr:radical SAM protein [Gammaproteobacteria bacterium]
MSDVLLATAFCLKNDPKQTAKMRPYAPLGTLFAAAAVRECGFSVALYDAMLCDGLEEFEALLAAERPAIVAIYEDQFNFLNKMCLGHARTTAFAISRKSREAGARVLAAGADVSDEPALYFKQGVEFAIAGEADETLCELVESLLGGRGPAAEDIRGLVFPDAGTTGGVRRTPRRPPQADADTFPAPAWDMFDAARYRTAWRGHHGYFSINMVTTRGCPFHCNWCAKPIWGQHYAIRSPRSVAEEMARLKREFQPDHIWFADDIFGLQPKWVARFADEVDKLNAAIPFMVQSRIDLMTKKAVKGLARAGCKRSLARHRKRQSENSRCDGKRHQSG